MFRFGNGRIISSPLMISYPCLVLILSTLFWFLLFG
ncbi:MULTISPECIES: YtcA family lipoprotein [Enterobacteriaceae]|nr:hypothetical protein [Salmonella enterica]QBY73551.1 hypothetical protein EIP71_18115 [Salmonella enterica subsp. enterica serovar Senftenberg]HBL7008453.1 hypothetical protein [Citrobacter koseri]HBZ9725852.1 hypothetical protein [Citrobacter farmeri]HDW0182327.1 hypothetical protein [Enterobacter asburiae]